MPNFWPNFPFYTSPPENTSKPFRGYTYCAPPVSAGGGGLNLLPNFQKGGAKQDFNFESGVAGKKRVTFFIGGCNFYKKNKLKSEIFNGKKSL